MCHNITTLLSNPPSTVELFKSKPFNQIELYIIRYLVSVVCARGFNFKILLEALFNAKHLLSEDSPKFNDAKVPILQY